MRTASPVRKTLGIRKEYCWRRDWKRTVDLIWVQCGCPLVGRGMEHGATSPVVGETGWVTEGLGLSHCTCKEQGKMGAETPRGNVTPFIYQSGMQWMNIKIAVWNVLHPKSWLCIKAFPNRFRKVSMILKKPKNKPQQTKNQINKKPTTPQKKLKINNKLLVFKFYIGFKCTCISVEMTEHGIELCSF